MTFNRKSLTYEFLENITIFLDIPGVWKPCIYVKLLMIRKKKSINTTIVNYMCLPLKKYFDYLQACYGKLISILPLGQYIIKCLFDYTALQPNVLKHSKAQNKLCHSLLHPKSHKIN